MSDLFAMSPEAELEMAGIAGTIITPAHDVVTKVETLLSGRAETFGLSSLLPAEAGEVLEALELLTGWRPDKWRSGRSQVDPARVVLQARHAAKRIREARERGERVLFGTGHPTGPLEMYGRLVDELRADGADVMHFAEGEPFKIEGVQGRFSVRYVAGVACLTDGGSLLHTHFPEPMEYLLSVGPRPDLVIGDHGFAGVALAHGIDAVALVDTNDPALVLAWARGLPIHPIVCDDNRPPDAYGVLLRLLLDA